MNNSTPTTTVVTNDSAVVRGVRTTVQTLIGFVVGLFLVVWAVPGVPHAVIVYVQANWATLALAVGIPSGLLSLIQNLLRPGVPNVKSTTTTTVQ